MRNQFQDIRTLSRHFLVIYEIGRFILLKFMGRLIHRLCSQVSSFASQKFLYHKAAKSIKEKFFAFL
jgi:hypothetical protein